MKIVNLDQVEVDYSLIGINCAEDDYRLAYLINQNLNTKFIRLSKNLDFKKSKAIFSIFEYQDDDLRNYYLIRNKHTKFIKNEENSDLFLGNFNSTTYLIPEKKIVDYFLKIEGYQKKIFLRNIINKLNKINQIGISIIIDPQTLKSRDNLIF